MKGHFMNYEINDFIDLSLEKITEQMEKYDIPSKLEEAENSEW